MEGGWIGGNAASFVSVKILKRYQIICKLLELLFFSDHKKLVLLKATLIATLTNGGCNDRSPPMLVPMVPC